MPPDERLVHDVVLLHRQRMSRRAIARALKVSRNTVRKILARHDQARSEEHTALPMPKVQKRPSKLDPFGSKSTRCLRHTRTSPPRESTRSCARRVSTAAIFKQRHEV
jgi:transposase